MCLFAARLPRGMTVAYTKYKAPSKITDADLIDGRVHEVSAVPDEIGCPAESKFPENAVIAPIGSEEARPGFSFDPAPELVKSLLKSFGNAI